METSLLEFMLNLTRCSSKTAVMTYDAMPILIGGIVQLAGCNICQNYYVNKLFCS